MAVSDGLLNALVSGNPSAAPAPLSVAPTGVDLSAQPSPISSPQAAPSSMGANPDPLHVSAWDVIQGVIQGHSPNDAVQLARQQKLESIQQRMQLQSAQQTAQWLSQQPPIVQAAYKANPAEFGKAVAQKFGQTVLNGGQTVLDGSGLGGPVTAPTVGFDALSGKGYAIAGDGSTSAPSPSLGGDIKPADGLINSSRGGPIGTYSTPKSFPASDSLAATTPTVNIPGSPLGASGPPPGAPLLGGDTGGGSGPASGNGTSAAGSMPRGLRNNNLPSATSTFPTAAQIAQATGGKITSGARTAAHNAAVGGVPNSYHLTGQAYDLVPQNGQSMADLAASTQKAFPGLKVLNEGTHIHIQPQSGTPRSSSGLVAPTLSGGVQTLVQGSGYRQNPDGTQTSPTGEISAIPGRLVTASDKNQLYDRVAKSDDYTQAKASLAAYQAMTSNARAMTGPSAYAILDTFARAINPGAVARPQVIQTIEKNLGPLAHVQGGWDSVLGKGNLTPQVRQQIIDAVHPFVQAHWQAANALNEANRQFAARTPGVNAADITAPLEPAPKRYNVRAAKFEPAPGEVQNGYRFLGGDPANPKSWAKQ